MFLEKISRLFFTYIALFLLCFVYECYVNNAADSDFYRTIVSETGKLRRELEEKKSELESKLAWWKIWISSDEKKFIEEQIKQIDYEIACIDSEGIVGKMIVHSFSQSWRMAANLLILWLLVSSIWKFIKYWFLADVVQRMQGVRMVEMAESVRGPSLFSEEKKLLSLRLEPGQKIVVRKEQFSAQYNNAEVRKGSQFVFSWGALMLSIACDMLCMVTYRNKSNCFREVSISSENPDDYFMRIDLKPNQRCYVRPSSLVAWSDGVHISGEWRLSSLSAWCIGQLRYYYITGPGFIVLRGEGGLTPFSQYEGGNNVVKVGSVVFCQEGMYQHVARTESFVNYIMGVADLFDLKLSGRGTFVLRNSNSSAERSLLHRYLGACADTLKVFLGI